MKKLITITIATMMAFAASYAQGNTTFSTRQIPVNRGGQEDGTVNLRFYDDMPSVAYISVTDFQQLMLPGTTISVTKKADGEYTLTGPYAQATVNTTTEQFSSDNYPGFTNLMGQIQEGMDNVVLDGSPFIRYRKQEVMPASATVTFDFKKYGIDLRDDNTDVFFPFATLADLYSDLYYHIASYNGEKVIVTTEILNSTIAKLDKEGTLKVINAESRNTDMAAYSYAELCFVVDHFYGMPGRSPLEDAIRKDGLDKALDNIENGATVKQLLKSTNMKEYMFGLNYLNILLDDGGHTDLKADLQTYQALEGSMEEAVTKWLTSIAIIRESYPELAEKLIQSIFSADGSKSNKINSVRPTNETYYKQGDTAYLLYGQFGPTNYAAWKAYYDGGCTGAIPAIDPNNKGDLSVVLDALKQANEDPEVKNLVIDLSLNSGGSLDIVLAMTALMGGQSHFYCENVLTGQRHKIYYDVDCNFDGKFDEKDKEVKYDLNYAVLTSGVSFSCANLFPSLMKDMGFPIIGERCGGGSCAVQYFVTPEGLQYRLSSALSRLTNDKWQNIDAGIEPTYVINTSEDYNGFYDIPTISNIIKDNITTRVKTLPVATVGKWYTLDGRCLNAQPSQSGVYIYNGRKIVK